MTWNNDSHSCFFISPIGDDASEVRKDSDRVVKRIVQPAVQPLGYNVVRADEIGQPGLIDHQIIQMVTESPLVIADLTGHNPNVFYELALRHVTGLPCVQIIKTGQSIPFDIMMVRTVPYDLSPNKATQAVADIAEQVKNCTKRTWGSANPTVDNPIEVAVAMQAFRSVAPYGGVDIVLDALIQDDVQPGYLQKLNKKAEVLFRILCDADESTQKRLSKEMDTLAHIGDMVRQVERSKIEGRFELYP